MNFVLAGTAGLGFESQEAQEQLKQEIVVQQAELDQAEMEITQQVEEIAQAQADVEQVEQVAQATEQIAEQVEQAAEQGPIPQQALKAVQISVESIYETTIGVKLKDIDGGIYSIEARSDDVNDVKARQVKDGQVGQYTGGEAKKVAGGWREGAKALKEKAKAAAKYIWEKLKAVFDAMFDRETKIRKQAESLKKAVSALPANAVGENQDISNLVVSRSSEILESVNGSLDIVEEYTEIVAQNKNYTQEEHDQKIREVVKSKLKKNRDGLIGLFSNGNTFDIEELEKGKILIKPIDENKLEAMSKINYSSWNVTKIQALLKKMTEAADLIKKSKKVSENIKKTFKQMDVEFMEKVQNKTGMQYMFYVLITSASTIFKVAKDISSFVQAWMKQAQKQSAIA